jgi:hypothetical protein
MLPAEKLTAVVSGIEIDLAGIGRPSVLVFHGQDTAAAAMEVNNAVRAAFPDPAEVLVASVIDLRQFPSMFHAMVKPELDKAYHKAAGKLPEGANAADLIVLLPDWKGATHDACGVTDSTKAAAVVIAAADGSILARSQSEGLGAAAVTALQNR